MATVTACGEVVGGVVVNPIPNCVPLNIFGGQGDGSGTITPEMLNYIRPVLHDNSEQELKDFTANITGSILPLPAGDLSFAIGVEHREQSGFYELHLVGRDGEGDRQLTSAAADHASHDWHPDGTRLVASRGHRNRFKLVSVDASDGSAEVLAEGGTWYSPQWMAGGDVVSGYDDHATPRELRRITPGEPPVTIHAPAPKAVRGAPHAELEDVTFPSFDGLEIPAFLMRPRNASSDNTPGAS